jgi:hypothetical protein
MIRGLRLAYGLFMLASAVALAGCDIPNLASDESKQADPGMWYGKPIKQWMLDVEDPDLSEQARPYLDRVGPQDKDLVPALIALLSDEDSTVRRGAARLLGQIGPPAKDALPALEEAISDPDKGVLREVLAAHKRIMGLKP